MAMDIANLGFRIDPSGAATGRAAIQGELRQVDESAKKTGENLKGIGKSAQEGLHGAAEGLEHVASKLGPLGKGGEEAARVFGGLAGVFSLFTTSGDAAAKGQAQLDAAFAKGTLGANTLAAAQRNAVETHQALSKATAESAAADAAASAAKVRSNVLYKEAEAASTALKNARLTEGTTTKELGELERLSIKARIDHNTASSASKQASADLRNAKIAEAGASRQQAEAEKLVSAGQASTALSTAAKVTATLALIGVIVAATVAIKAFEVAFELAMEGIKGAANDADIVDGMKRVAGGLHEAETIYKGFEAYSATHSFIDKNKLAEGYVALRNVNVGLNDTQRILSSFSAAAAGNINPAAALDNMLQAWTKIEAKGDIGGKGMLRALEQLEKQGIHLVPILRDQLGGSVDDITKRFHDGTINVNQMRDALLAWAGRNPQVFKDAEDRANNFKNTIGNIKQTWEQVLESFGQGFVADPALLAMLQEFRKTLEGLKGPAEEWGKKIADSIRTVLPQISNDLKAALGGDDVGTALSAMMIKWGAIATKEIARTLAAALLDITIQAIEKINEEKRTNTGSEGSEPVPQLSEAGAAAERRRQANAVLDNFRYVKPDRTWAPEYVTSQGLAPDAKSDTGAKPGAFKPAGGAGGATLKEAETTWDKINKLQVDYYTGQGLVDQGLMTQAELLDKLGDEGQKAFAKIYDHAKAQEYIDLTLRGDARIIASALNKESARVQAAKAADRAIALGYATTGEAALRGIQKATDSYREMSMVVANVAEAATQQFASGFTDAFMAFANGTKTAKQAFLDFAKTFLDSIAKMIMQQLILNAISQFLSPGATYNASGGYYEGKVVHSGGVIGDAGMASATFPAALFAGAPRLHNGLAGDEFPAILQRGETVIPRGGSAGGGGVAVNVNMSSGEGGTSDEDKRVAKRLGRELPAFVKEIIAKEKRQGGMLSRSAIMASR